MMSVTAPKGPNLLPQLFDRQNDTNIYKFRTNLFRERLRLAKNLYKYDLVSHYGCVNAIEFSNEGELLISGGDDRRVLLWNLEKAIAGKGQPVAMEKEHDSNIFCLSFNRDNTKIFSGGNDDAVIAHDVITGDAFDVYVHVKPVYGLSVDPTNDNILSTAGEDGQILVFDLRKDTEVLSLGKCRGPFHAVQFHPQDGNFLVTANSRKGAAFWDIRKPPCPMIQYGGEGVPQTCMSIRFNSNGSQVLVLRRRLPPILYNTFSQKPVCQFYHPDYYNSCTMKSCSFAGEDDEFVLSGSDDFNLYVWRVGDVDPEINDQWIESTQMVLYGHRSIVNQVRYNKQKCIFASSGVEKIVKLWSPFSQNNWTGSLTEEATGPENPRDVFSQDAYFSLIHMNWSTMTHDYSNQNTLEDPRMMAFFDSLVQQEIEGWDSNNTSDSDQCSRSSENSTRQSSTESSDDDLTNCFVHTRDRSRRGTTSSSIKPQRTKYTNRIAYLIATKRNTLRRLALKGASQSNRRRQNSIKSGKRKHQTQRNGPRTTRNGSGSKRTGRYGGLSSRTKSRDENEIQKNMRYKNYNHTSMFRSFRRKHKNSRIIANSDSSSEENRANRTDGLSGTNLTNGTSNPSNFAIPSTSTGITSSSTDVAYCLRQQQIDSDDDNTPVESDNENEVRTHRVPESTPDTKKLNGQTSKEITTQLSSDIDEDRYSSQTNHRKRHARSAPIDFDIYSSHSNSRLSNSSYLEDEHDSTSTESLDCFSKKRKFISSSEKSNDAIHSQSSVVQGPENIASNNNAAELKTPNGIVNHNASLEYLTPDSGIGSSNPRCSSSANIPSHSTDKDHTNNSNQNCNIYNNSNETPCNGDVFAIKLFHQKLARVRRNYKKKFGDDSESD